MTLEEMRGQLRSAMRDPSGHEYADAALDRLLNDGVRDVVLKTKCYTGRWTRTTTAGIEQYAIPDDCIRMTALSYDIYPLRPIADAHYNIRNSNNQGTPWGYFVVNRGFGLVPIPNAAETLTIDGIKWPDEMTQDGEECPLPVEMHQLPVLFGMYRTAFVYDPANTEMHLNRYMMEVQRVRDDMTPDQLDEFEHIIYTPSQVRATYFKGTSIRVEEPD